MGRVPTLLEGLHSGFLPRFQLGRTSWTNRGPFRMDFCDLIVSMEQAEISPRPVIGAIVVVSGLAVSFLLWLLYVHRASADFAGRWMFLPALNALLNGLCAIALCVGLYFIKNRRKEAHRKSMLLAFVFSSVFLVSYIVNHALHGDTIFPGHDPVRTLYLSILTSHVILSIVGLPMVLTTFFFSLTGRFAMHRRIARLTFPIWLYVSTHRRGGFRVPRRLTPTSRRIYDDPDAPRPQILCRASIKRFQLRGTPRTPRFRGLPNGSFLGFFKASSCAGHTNDWGQIRRSRRMRTWPDLRV